MMNYPGFNAYLLRINSLTVFDERALQKEFAYVVNKSTNF